jgi:hypothetical protein
MSKLRFSSRPHARFHANRASVKFVALCLAGILFFSGGTVKSNAAARLTNSPLANGEFAISWNSRGTLEMAAQLSGPWITVSNATNPYTNQMMAGAQFFRLNQTVDATTLHQKVLCGYQGWFRCPMRWLEFLVSLEQQSIATHHQHAHVRDVAGYELILEQICRTRFYLSGRSAGVSLQPAKPANGGQTF